MSAARDYVTSKLDAIGETNSSVGSDSDSDRLDSTPNGIITYNVYAKCRMTCWYKETKTVIILHI